MDIVGLDQRSGISVAGSRTGTDESAATQARRNDRPRTGPRRQAPPGHARPASPGRAPASATADRATRAEMDRSRREPEQQPRAAQNTDASDSQPCRCLWRGSSQTTKTTPRRRTILHLSQMRRTLARTFIRASWQRPPTPSTGSGKSDGKSSTIETLPPGPQGEGLKMRERGRKNGKTPVGGARRPGLRGLRNPPSPRDRGRG